MSPCNENGYDGDKAVNEWTESPLLGVFFIYFFLCVCVVTHNLALSKTGGRNGAKTITKLYLLDLIPSYGPKVITFKLQN